MLPRSRSTVLAALAAGSLLALPRPARAATPGNAGFLAVSYHGGPLMRHVRVVTLFWGPSWEQGPLRAYFNGFFTALFTDERYLANLAQYSVAGSPIGNGELAATATDDSAPPPVVLDGQVRAEISAAIAAGRVPVADDNTLYVVYTPPQVMVVNDKGQVSGQDFDGYHSYTWNGGFAYAVIPYGEPGNELPPGQIPASDAPPMTAVASHELAEAVTDPQPYLQTLGAGGWYNASWGEGEIADIVVSLRHEGEIGDSDLFAPLRGAGGIGYWVQAVWSNRDQAPAAYAPAAAR